MIRKIIDISFNSHSFIFLIQVYYIQIYISKSIQNFFLKTKGFKIFKILKLL
jgi:hypothetical protein